MSKRKPATYVIQPFEEQRYDARYRLNCEQARRIEGGWLSLPGLNTSSADWGTEMRRLKDPFHWHYIGEFKEQQGHMHQCDFY